MGLTRSIGSAMRVVADALDPSRDGYDPRWWADHSLVSVAGVPVTERSVLQLGAVQAVRFGLSSAMSSLPVMVFERGADGGRKERPDHPLSRLLSHRPNAWQTPAEVFGDIAWHLSFYRNIYCIIHPGSGDYAIGEIEVVHPRRLVKIERRDGRRYYTFSRVDGATGVNDTYRDDQIWHVRGAPLQVDGLMGEGIWETAREVFGRALAVHQYGDLWFRNSGQTGGTLEHPGTFKDKDERQKFLDAWRDSGTGANRHRDRLLTHGVKYNPLKVTNAEAQLLETETRSDIEIFGLWSFPPHRAARLDRATFSNIEQQSIDFVVYTLAPLAIAIEQSIERDLLLANDDNALFVEFNFAELLRGDLRSTYQALLLGRQGEWLSANDCRRVLRMNPRNDAGGDEYRNPLTKDSGASDASDEPGSEPRPAQP